MIIYLTQRAKYATLVLTSLRPHTRRAFKRGTEYLTQG